MGLEEMIRELVREEIRAALKEWLGAPCDHPQIAVAGEGYRGLPDLADQFGVSAAFLGGLARSGKLSALRAGRRWVSRENDVRLALKPPPPTPSAGISHAELQQRAAEMVARGRASRKR